MAEIALTVGDLQVSSRRKRKEAMVRWALFTAAALSVVITVLIVVSLVGEAWTLRPGRGLHVGQPHRRSAGSRAGASTTSAPCSIGSLLVTGIAMIVAWPLGLGSAIYLSEYAKPRVRRTLKPILEILAGIPSIVLGLLRPDRDLP